MKEGQRDHKTTLLEPCCTCWFYGHERNSLGFQSHNFAASSTAPCTLSDTMQRWSGQLKSRLHFSKNKCIFSIYIVFCHSFYPIIDVHQHTKTIIYFFVKIIMHFISFNIHKTLQLDAYIYLFLFLQFPILYLICTI